MTDIEAVVTCREVLTFLLAYLSKELPPEREQAFEAHLETCPACVSYLETYRTAVELGKAADAGEAEPEPPAELVAAILASRRKPPG